MDGTNDRLAPVGRIAATIEGNPSEHYAGYGYVLSVKPHSDLGGNIVECLLETEANLPEEVLNWTLLSSRIVD